MAGLKMWKKYLPMKAKSKPEVQILPRLSLTGDIVAYRICPRQYGFFAEKGFVPAHTVQIFYGTIIHEVLDRTHHHYQGFEDSKTKGKIPSDKDIVRYFAEVESSLKARGIRVINRRLRDQALEVLKQFNRVEGPRLYPLVIDTEHRVRGTRGDYLMEGVVDVLVGPDADPNNPPEDPSEWEIWDYKGQRRTKEGANLQSYIYQMQVYSALYKIKNGCLPKSAKLYFLNELRNAKTSSPPSAVLEISISEKKIHKALEEFDATAAQIAKSCEEGKWDCPNPKRAREIKDTCTICDFRWSCPAWESKPFPMQYP
jgi:DNA helicase-2/ATP-dependent DNA helicase PcrA